jgi:hypothetical protein
LIFNIFFLFSEPGVETYWFPWRKTIAWPDRPVSAGAYREGGANNEMFIAKLRHESSEVVGYAYHESSIYVGWHGQEISEMRGYQILCIQ